MTGVEILAQDRLPLRRARRAPLHLLLQIESRGEDRSGTAHNDGPHVGIALETIEGAPKLGEHGLAQGIGPLGAIERNARSSADPLDLNGVEWHLVLLRLPRPLAPPQALALHVTAHAFHGLERGKSVDPTGAEIVIAARGP
jgi:hypothetical protein